MDVVKLYQRADPSEKFGNQNLERMVVGLLFFRTVVFIDSLAYEFC